MKRARRLEPWYRVTCNGDDRDGCAFLVETGGAAKARQLGATHAETEGHEVVVCNVNDGLVLDGRPR